MAQTVKKKKKIYLQCRTPGFNPWVGKIPWRREWLHTPVFLPGEFHGQKSLQGYSPWGRKELDLTELLTLFFFFPHTQWASDVNLSFSILATLLGSHCTWLNQIKAGESLDFARMESCGCTISSAAPCVAMVWGWGQSCCMDPEPGPIQGKQTQRAKPSNILRAFHEATPEVGTFHGVFQPTWASTFFQQSNSASLHLTETRIRLGGRKLSDLAKVPWSDWGSVSGLLTTVQKYWYSLHDLEGRYPGKGSSLADTAEPGKRGDHLSLRAEHPAACVFCL